MVTTYTVTTVSLFILPSLWGKLCREYEDAKKTGLVKGLDWPGLVMQKNWIGHVHIQTHFGLKSFLSFFPNHPPKVIGLVNGYFAGKNI